PVALRAQDYVAAAVERDRTLAGLHFKQHFRVVEARERELPIVSHWFRAKARPKSLKSFARSPIDSPEALAAHKINASEDKFVSEAGLAEFFQHGQPFQFREVVEKPRPNATGRFPFDKPDEVGSAVVVPIEFFREWALLFRDVNGGSNRINH